MVIVWLENTTVKAAFISRYEKRTKRIEGEPTVFSS
jgi:hypothetical protein